MVAAHLFRSACSTLSRSTGLERVQTGYWPYFISDEKAVLLVHVRSLSAGFSSWSQQDSLLGVERLVATKGNIGKAASESIFAVAHVKILLALRFFGHVSAFPGETRF